MALNMAPGASRAGNQFAPPACEMPTYYAPVSWKGIPFHVESSADEVGRRIDVYEYALSEDIGSKDLGRRARRFKVEGYLIGTDQGEKTRAMARAAESPEPGYLVHPIFGRIRVSCITLTCTADYRKDKKRTKLAFEFVEAMASMAPYATARSGATQTRVFEAGNAAVTQSRVNPGINLDIATPFGADAFWYASTGRMAQLAQPVPANDERAHDALDMLQPTPMGPAQTFTPTPQGGGVEVLGLARDVAPLAAVPTYQPARTTFVSLTAPFDVGSATIRRLHLDALERFKDFNRFVVDRSEEIERTASGQSLLVTIRLILARDFALAALRTDYETIKAALDDLDWLMAVYDDEEEIATRNCDDVLVNLIRTARATAAAAILAQNIRRPGIAIFPVDGEWPSLVVAHKIYADATRHEQVERYNAHQSVWFMGREVSAPAS